MNAQSSPGRQRYTIGHELLHFLSERHRPTVAQGFACTAVDLNKPKGSGQHLIQEQEANTFAIEVLTPREALLPFIGRAAELNHALAIADRFEVRREAAIRRYVDIQGECLAAIFSKDGRVRYVEKAKEFPATTVWAGDKLGHLLVSRGSTGLTTLDEVDPSDWLRKPAGYALYAQSLFQKSGYAVTLLVAEQDEPDEGDQPVWPR